MKARDGRAIARHNEINVLKAIHRWGFLRTRDIASIVWKTWVRDPAGEPDIHPIDANASELRMAQRTLRRLRDTHQVLHTQAPDGSIIYALAEAGARRLRRIGIAADSGKDLIRAHSGSHYRHRTIANEIAVAAIVAGYRISTEHEIARNRWMGSVAGIGGKKPDVLLRHDNRVWWVEVDRSVRNARDYTRLLAWLGAVAADVAKPSGPTLLGNGAVWAKIIFVCSPASRTKLCRDLEAAGWKKSLIDALLSFEVALYSFEDILFVRP